MPQSGVKGRNLAMLMGTYPHSLDAKNRLIIPSKLKSELGDTIVLSRDSDRCLAVYSIEEWERYAAKFDDHSKSSAKRVSRLVFGLGSQVQLDSQGRAVIPQNMVEYAGITKNVVIVGCGRYAEIWSEERWNQFEAEADPDEIAEILESLGI